MATKAKPTATVEQTVSDFHQHIKLRGQTVTDNIEALEEALRPFRALEWLIRGGMTLEHATGDLSHLDRGDLAELVATLTEAAQAKVTTAMEISRLIWKV